MLKPTLCIIFLAATIFEKVASLPDGYRKIHEKYPVDSRIKRNASIPCVNGTFIINPTEEETKIKILSDNGEVLFSSDVSKSSFEKINTILPEPITPTDTLTDREKGSYILIVKQKYDGGEVITLLKRNRTLFQLGNETAEMKRTESVCVYLKQWKIIIDPVINLNKLDGSKNTPLHWATRIDALEAVKDLVEKGADVNAPGPLNVTPLFFAAAVGQDDIMQYLIQHGANVNLQAIASPLHVAALLGRVNATRFLTEHGANVNSKTTDDGETPLHMAALKGHLAVAQILVSKGADPNLKNKLGRTPLHMASLYGQVELTHYLIKSGANVNSKDRDGETPLILIIKYVSPEDRVYKIAELLIKNYNADINVKDYNDLTPLSLATSYNYTKVEGLLRKKGAIS